MIDHPPRVFISYAQESESHCQWVFEFAKRLRDDGVDARIDRYFPWVENGWRAWMNEQIKNAEWVLVVCTAEYDLRFEGAALPGSGRGVRWESQHITQALYDQKFHNKRFVPVLPPEGDECHIPLALKDFRRFRLGDGREGEYDALYGLLTEQNITSAPALGSLRRLARLPAPEQPSPPIAETCGDQAASSRAQHNQTSPGLREVGNQPESEEESQARARSQGPKGETETVLTQGKGNDENLVKIPRKTILTRAKHVLGGILRKPTIALIALCLVPAAAFLGWKYWPAPQESPFMLLVGSGTVMEALAKSGVLKKSPMASGGTQVSSKLYSYQPNKDQANKVYSVDVGSQAGLDLLFLASQHRRPRTQTAPLLAAIVHRITPDWQAVPILQVLRSGDASYFRLQIGTTQFVMLETGLSCNEAGSVSSCIQQCLSSQQCYLLVPGRSSGTLLGIIAALEEEECPLASVFLRACLDEQQEQDNKKPEATNTAKYNDSLKQCTDEQKKKLNNNKSDATNMKEGAPWQCERIIYGDVRDECAKSAAAWVALANEHLIDGGGKHCFPEKHRTRTFGNTGLYLYGAYPVNCEKLRACEMDANICAYINAVYTSVYEQDKRSMGGPPVKCRFKQNLQANQVVGAESSIWE